MKRLALITVILISLFNISAFAQTEFKLKWQAKRLSKSCFTVTKDENNVAGAIWWPNTVDLTKNLDLHFLVYMGDKDAGADGLGFVFHNDPAVFNARGDVGGGLYFGKHPSQGNVYAIQPSVAIEIDTYRNTGCASGIHDPRNADNTADVDHTTVVYNGDICNPKFPAIQFHKSKINIEDNTCYPAIIKWRPGTGGNPDELSLYVDGEHRFTYTDYMVRDVFANNTNVYYGFTGSTGGARNEQTICIFEGNDVPKAQDDFASTPYGTPVDVDVQANDGDADGDDIFTNEITIAPKHGTATILARDKVRYTPFAGFAGLDSLQYEIVDIDPLLTSPDKCYVNRTQAWVFFNKVNCPTYSLAVEKIKDNHRCAPGGTDNGAGRAYMLNGGTKITDGFEFYWYKGTLTAAQIKALGKNSEDYKGKEITNLADGDYTVYARLNVAGSDSCAFNFGYVNIGLNTDKPAFTIKMNPTDFTTCNVVNNSFLYVDFNDPNTDKSLYTYRWYENYPITLLGTDTTFKSLQPKTYTLEVTNKLSGCSFAEGFNVQLKFTSPKIDTVVVGRTSCDVKNGSISAKVNNLTNGYEFIWAEATDINFLAPIHTGPNLQNLDTGVYYVKAKDLTSGCFLTDIIKIKVRDLRKNPVLTASSIVNQTSCDPSKPNGSITITNVDNGQPLANYTFSWFEGDNTTNALASAKVNNNTAIKLAKGTYRVVIKNIATGCTYSEKFDVLDNFDNPRIHTVTHTNQTDCTPANGALTVMVDPDKGGPRAPTNTGYTFQWKKNGANISTSNILTGLSAGTYTVQAISSLGCFADTTFVISDATSTPVIALTPTNDTSCDPNQPNGKVDAVITGVATGVNLRYEWYDGNNTTVAIGSAINSTNTTASLTGRNGSNHYTLKVTNLATGCFATKFVLVGKTSLPGFVVTAPNVVTANCISSAGTDATLTANVGGNITDYDFLWYEGDQVKNTPDFTGASVTGKKPGEYMVMAVHKTSHCESTNAVKVTIDFVPTYTAPITITGSLNGCLVSTAFLTATPSSVGPHTYAWYKGIADLPYYPYFSAGRTVLSTSATITPVTPNVYSVVVKDNNGCTIVEKYDLSLMSSVPAVVLKSATNNTNCTNPNGKIEIDYIIPDPLTSPGVRVYPIDPAFASYKIYWISGFQEPAVLPTHTNSPVYTGLGQGPYGVIVDIGAPCNSPFTPANIIDAFTYPNLTVSRVNQTNCPPPSSAVLPNGSIRVDINNYTGNAADYTYSVTKDGNPYSVSPTVTNPLIIPNVGVGSYNVTVRLVATTCPTSRTIVIADDHVAPLGTVAVINNTQCQAPFDGSVTVDNDDLSQYEYHWYLKSTGAEIANASGDDIAITLKQHDQYFLRIVDRTTHCESSPIDGDILDNSVTPTIAVSNILSRTSCDQMDGSTTVTLGPEANYTFYSLNWNTPHSGAPDPTIVSTGSANQFIAQGLDTGIYVLTVLDPTRKCSDTKTFRVGLNQNIPQLTLTATDKTTCAPYNGTLTASIVAGTGVNPVAPILWERFENGVRTPLPAYNNNLTPTNVPEGDYLVWAADDGKNCKSIPVQVRVVDKTPKLQINLVQLSHQTRCDSLVTQNGSISINVTPAGVYSYRWLKNGNPIGGATTPSINGLSRGEYIAEVTSVGCVFKDTFHIRNQKVNFIPVVAKQNVTRCEAPYDGLLVASVNGSTNGYTFTWTHLTTNATYNSAVAQNLPAGNYSLNVTNTVTTCDTTIFVTLDFVPQPFEIMATEEKPVSNCDPMKGNGEIRVDVNGEVAGYQFDWYETSSLASSAPVVAFTGNVVNQLKHVSYTIRARNLITACEKDLVVTPTFLPVIVVAPVVDSIRNVTSCITPNGFAEVSAGGSNANHIFNWYIGTELKATPDFTGYAQENLEIGDYLVTATDRLSGCVSSPVKVAIGDSKIFVDIKASVKNSLCHTNSGEASITWIEPVGVAEIYLDNGTEKIAGDVFQNLPHGDFHITLETEEGCVTEKDITIGADWLVFNGVSPNNDGNNDFLSIDCIELFSNNTVKIFNRAGALVYVGEGYDNEQVRFDGSGNRGIYTTGNRLPDGTYYYVVDPGDGRKPKAGFFELLR